MTEYAMLRVGRTGTVLFEPMKWPLKTSSATVLLVHNSGCKSVTLDEARRQIRKPTLVAVAYRQDDRPKRQPLHELLKDVGPPTLDGAAVLQTLSRILRPGTLAFVLSARKNIPEP